MYTLGKYILYCVMYNKEYIFREKYILYKINKCCSFYVNYLNIYIAVLECSIKNKDYLAN